MAKNKDKAAKGAKSKKSGGLSFFAILVMGVLLFMVALPTFITLVVGLLPSVLAFFFDRHQGRYLARCVFGLNFSGVAPYVMELWHEGGQSVSIATQQLLDPMTMVIMYGAAGLGWLMYLAMPPIVANVLNLTAQRRTVELREQQRELVKIWGENLISEIEKGHR
ncbi:hypothetical protein TH25_09940 [Thalassospira profundimaris]|uniref:Uncharacterized protein n=1 Tax=Thalassospira profundimaris TaxID=502049 RepID=A0A367XEQ9_9PROT|nr:hypothetical protein [Thalassospira profundimaris]RCK51271.1 hypothetical protein TH25_09940 [Thalassospira profundimaris]